MNNVNVNVSNEVGYDDNDDNVNSVVSVVSDLPQ